jgi:hypothetical protein
MLFSVSKKGNFLGENHYKTTKLPIKKLVSLSN